MEANESGKRRISSAKFEISKMPKSKTNTESKSPPLQESQGWATRNINANTKNRIKARDNFSTNDKSNSRAEAWPKSWAATNRGDWGLPGIRHRGPATRR